jgi:hypothetical protein
MPTRLQPASRVFHLRHPSPWGVSFGVVKAIRLIPVVFPFRSDGSLVQTLSLGTARLFSWNHATPDPVALTRARPP